MDPISALSVAAAAVAFVDFSCKLIVSANKIRKAGGGATIQNQDAQAAVERLRELVEKLQSASGNGQQASVDLRLKEICDGCLEISKKLVAKYESFKAPEREQQRVRDSLKIAWRVFFAEGEIDAMEKQLQRYKEELNSYITASLSEKLDNFHLAHKDNGLRLIAVVEELKQWDINIFSRLDILTAMQEEKKTEILRREAKKEASKRLQEKNEQNHAVEDRILNNLRFPTMNKRYEEVQDPCANTFTWIFNEDQNDRARCCFGEFVVSDTNIFWVTGKAGSGKSTLMRYICKQDTLAQRLRRWSNGEEVIVAKFFFWSSGSPEQRTQESLLQCLLYQVLNNHRELIEQVFPEHWHELDRWSAKSQLPATNYTLNALKEAFLRLADKATQSLRICFFVDGLDECEGTEAEMKHYALAEMMKEASTRQWVKVCVSSRPWQAFEDVFAGCHSLRMQDLTENDMRIFIEQQIDLSPKAARYKASNPEAISKLLQDILEKAEGVFLWVCLVVNSVICGMMRRERLEVILHRVYSTPSKLDDLYQHMLDQIEEKSRAAQIFLMFRSALSRHLDVSPLIIGLALESSDQSAMSPVCVGLAMDEWFRIHEMMEAALRTLCQGLIEMSCAEEKEEDEVLFGKSKNGVRPPSHMIIRGSYSLCIFRSRLKYMHRTAEEFLSNANSRKKLREWSAAESHFHPLTSIMKGYVVFLKRLPGLERRQCLFDIYTDPIRSLRGFYELRQEGRVDNRQFDQLFTMFHRLSYNLLEHGYISTDECALRRMPQNCLMRESELDLIILALDGKERLPWLIQRMHDLQRFFCDTEPLRELDHVIHLTFTYPVFPYDKGYFGRCLPLVAFLLQFINTSQESRKSDLDEHRSHPGAPTLSKSYEIVMSYFGSHEPTPDAAAFVELFLNYGASIGSADEPISSLKIDRCSSALCKHSQTPPWEVKAEPEGLWSSLSAQSCRISWGMVTTETRELWIALSLREKLEVFIRRLVASDINVDKIRDIIRRRESGQWTPPVMKDISNISEAEATKWQYCFESDGANDGGPDGKEKELSEIRSSSD